MQRLTPTPGGAARLSNQGGHRVSKRGAIHKNHHFSRQSTLRSPSFSLSFFHALLFKQTGSTQIPRLRQQHLKINWHGGVFPWQPASSLPVYTCIITIRLQHHDCRDERRRKAFSRYRDVFNDIMGAQRVHTATRRERTGNPRPFGRLDNRHWATMKVLE